jgi:hypothetical protein
VTERREPALEQEYRMFLRTRRARLAGVAAALALLAPACTGPFKAVHAIHEFNEEPDSKWAQEAVFLAFVILPVYGIGILIDAIVLNPIDFFDRP